jgi:hypothetical protein
MLNLLGVAGISSFASTPDVVRAPLPAVHATLKVAVSTLLCLE